jgi:hypothetical protein
MAIFTIGTTSTSFSPEAQDVGYVGSSFDTNSWTGNVDPQSERRLHVLYAAFANVKYFDTSGNERVEFILGRNGFGSTDKVSNVLGDKLTTSSYSKVRFGLTEASKETLLGDGTIYYFGVYNPSTSGVETTRTSQNIPIFGSGTTYHTVRANNTLVGNGQQHVDFYVYGLPNKGNTPTATVTGSSSVSLSWTAATAPDSQGTPTHYAVRYRVSGTSTWTSLYRTTTTTSKSISGLSASTTYEFQVAAQNGISAFSGFTSATGAWSSSRTATTDSDAPPLPLPSFSPSSVFVNGIVGQDYGTRTVNISDAQSVTTRTGHSVPPGLTPSSGSTFYRLTGTPTTQGSYSINLRATNSEGGFTDYTDPITIDPAPLPQNPVWNTQNYADPYVGVSYSSQVTATNTVSYSSTFPFATYGLSLNTTNGRITGIPIQPDSPIQLSTLTFTIVANGATGTTPASKTFTVNFRFPGRRMTGSTSSTKLTIARRFNGTDWLPIQKGERMTGSNTDTPLSGF